ncbi:hypothetical protein [Cytobacillus stercorigallinarum]|uniref:hypothetical protein n=1 Tax=Cytobacillus stercorigallinarum TaxID=2762240 RepID=UPI001CD8CFED|nr:hypothetical protein [Cytobacillus stercorigallinarum]
MAGVKFDWIPDEEATKSSVKSPSCFRLPLFVDQMLPDPSGERIEFYSSVHGYWHK